MQRFDSWWLLREKEPFFFRTMVPGMLPMFQWVSLHSCAHRKHTSDFVSHKKQRKNEIEKKYLASLYRARMFHAGCWGKEVISSLIQLRTLQFQSSWQDTFTGATMAWLLCSQLATLTLDLRSTLQERTHTKYYRPSQKNMAEEVLGPCTKLISKYLCLCPNKNAIPRPDQRNLSLQ